MDVDRLKQERRLDLSAETAVLDVHLESLFSADYRAVAWNRLAERLKA